MHRTHQSRPASMALDGCEVVTLTDALFDTKGDTDHSSSGVLYLVVVDMACINNDA